MEKICAFCGEPIAGGLQKHDFATCAHNLRDRVIQLEAALKKSVKANAAGQAENELLWMYYKANKESGYDSFQEAEKRIRALEGK